MEEKFENKIQSIQEEIKNIKTDNKIINREKEKLEQKTENLGILKNDIDIKI